MPNRKSGGCHCCGGSGPGANITIPGCFCTSIPSTLSLTVTYGPGESAATYGHQVQDATLSYFTTAPGYIPSSAFPGPGFYSTAAWVDDYGYTDYYFLTCFSSQFSLGIGQYGGMIWQAPGQIYNWAMGSKTPVNFCNPFLLGVGQVQPGTGFNVKFTISG